MDLLRSTIQPVTHNLPPPIRDFTISLLGDQCYKTLLLDLDPSATQCLKLAISKGLGLGIISTSAIVKVPQLLKLINSKSSKGISFFSYLLETASYLISLSYNVRQGFPFSTFGETALISVQNVAIAVLVLQYAGKSAAATTFVAGLAAAGYSLFSKDVVDMNMLSYLQAGAGVLGIASKAPQILTNWQQGGTGQLSAFAVFSFLAGSLSRIFTTIQEVDDKLILYGFIAGFALNVVLATQMIYYWNAPSKKGTSRKGKQREGYAMGSGTVNSATPGKGKGPSTRRRG